MIRKTMILKAEELEEEDVEDVAAVAESPTSQMPSARTWPLVSPRRGHGFHLQENIQGLISFHVQQNI